MLLLVTGGLLACSFPTERSASATPPAPSPGSGPVSGGTEPGPIDLKGAAPTGPIDARSSDAVAGAYQAELRQLQAKRLELRGRFDAARTEVDRRAVWKDARAFLVPALERLTSHWMGTRWEFYGTTTTPRQGSIACGYFVTTVLRDAGFHIDRDLLAKQAAGHIIRTFLFGAVSVHTWHGLSMTEFRARMSRLGDGLYIVGLDYHVGFLFKTARGTSFVHSSYYDPPLAVVRQTLLERSPLSDSRIRMVGNITADDLVITRWLKGTAFETRTGR